MPKMHAKLSPSSSHIWLHCPPSVRLSEKFDDQTTVYAEEGTEAHALCEYELRKALGEDATDPKPGMKYYTQEMKDAADGYVETVLQFYHQLGLVDQVPSAFIEEHVDFSAYVPGGFGTSDIVLLGGDMMVIIDFKYGKGVEVSAEHNTQLMCYALGAYEAYSALYDIEEVILAIYQPRLNSFSSWNIMVTDLLTWAETELRPKALMAEAGEGDYAAGDWCRFCKARGICRERSRKNLEAVRYDFKLPPELTDEEVSDILNLIDDLEAWAKDIKSYAMRSILSGAPIDGWKVVEGRSNRKYTDESAVAAAVTEAGFDPYEKKVLGITAMTTLLGKKQFNELLGEYIEKPSGKPVLVRADDKRPEYDNVKNAFKEEDDYE